MSKRTAEQNLRDLKRQETLELFYIEEEPEAESDDVPLDEEEWEDVPLDGVSVTVSLPENEKHPKKKLRTHQYQRLKFGLHIALMPFMLRVLRQRWMWTQDERLNRRLRRSVPKVINQRFNRLFKERNFNKLRTLLLGLVFWFRSHYQINSNGFRQNFNRLQYLVKYSNTEVKPRLYASILRNQHLFYGERPSIRDGIEDVRQMAKKKKSNRDILVVFFLIILKNLLPSNVQINLCFALPLHDYEFACHNVKRQMNHGIGRVPDRFDTDLLAPFFWIELRFNCRLDEFYIIDPVVNLKEEEIVTRHAEVEAVTTLQPYFKIHTKLKVDYIVSINCADGIMTDVSPRYLPNLYYRYFKPLESSIVLHSLGRKSYEIFIKLLGKYSKDDTSHFRLMEKLAAKHRIIPETLHEMKRSPCYIIPSLLKKNETLRSCSQHVGNFRKELVYQKCDVLLLKSLQHWAQLGRSVKPGSTPLKSKKYVSMKKRREQRQDLYEIRELFSIEQTSPTPKLPSTYTDQSGQLRPLTDVDFYSNKFGHIEIYSHDTIPDGFHLMPLQCKHVIKLYNKRCLKTGQQRIKYLEVLSGFDFRKRPGYAMPEIRNLFVNSQDYYMTVQLLQDYEQKMALQRWNDLIINMKLQKRLDDAYGDLAQPQ
ncbi:RAD34 (YDR314C) [Zygosaccharomyces parabailii]|nr:RAD34 (YDR314C) [Zygosaccharomyces parabailii]